MKTFRPFARTVALITVTAGAFTFLPTFPARALIVTGDGNDPVRDPGWSEGALAVANLESRIGWWEGPPVGGGEWHFQYRGDTDTLNQVLAAFAKIKAPRLELVVHDTRSESRDSSADESGNRRLDWTFTIWVTQSWQRMRGNRPIAPPRLDLHLDEGTKVDWAKVKVPATVKIHDERTAAVGIPADRGSVVRVDVFDVASGKPMAGARVEVARVVRTKPYSQREYEPVAQGVSDASGRAQVERIPAGSHWVLVNAEGCAPLELAYARYGKHTFRQYRAKLAPTADFSGRVTDQEGRPLADVSVRAELLKTADGNRYGYGNPMTNTDQDGRFKLTRLPVGTITLWATAPDGYFGKAHSSHPVPASDVLLQLPGVGKIHVSVTDREGNPYLRYGSRKILVEVEDRLGSAPGRWGGSATIKDDGTFEFTRVTPGEYRVTCRPNPSTTGKQYVPEQLITVIPGSTVSVKIAYP